MTVLPPLPGDPYARRDLRMSSHNVTNVDMNTVFQGQYMSVEEAFAAANFDRSG